MQKEEFEQLLNRHHDDLAISITRSLERLEERLDAMESRIYSRFGDLEDNNQKRYENIVEILKLINDKLTK